MRRLALVGVLVVLALGTTAAFAQGPRVTTPRDGDRIGPAIDVEGNLGHKGLIVIITDVWRGDTHEKIATIPGIRHYTEEDGSFSFHVATPRNYRGEEADLTYKVRVFELKGPKNPGPETVVTCHAANR
jgi:hypothetical protein